MVEKSQYKSLAEWKKSNPSEYNKAFKEGWLDDICNIFGWRRFKQRKPNNYWTKERCLEEARKYKTKSEWAINSNSSYAKAMSRFEEGFFEKCTSHMISNVKPAGYWNIKENCIEEGKKYKTREEWEKKSVTSYNFAERNYWLGECMPIKINYDLIKLWNNIYNERKITI